MPNAACSWTLYCILPLYTTLYHFTRIIHTHFYADLCKVREYNNPIDQDETCYSRAHTTTHVAQQTSKIYRNDSILRSFTSFRSYMWSEMMERLHWCSFVEVVEHPVPACDLSAKLVCSKIEEKCCQQSMSTKLRCRPCWWQSLPITSCVSTNCMCDTNNMV